MTQFRLALYTFAQFRERAEDPINEPFFANEPATWTALESAEGFVARSGYDGEPGSESWGVQVFPKYWTDNGDGWAPSTLSLWQDLECALAAVYRGPHAEIMKVGHLFVKEAPSYPPYVLWWVAGNERPDWNEAIRRHESLGDHGPTPEAFSFRDPYDPARMPARVDAARVKLIAQRNQDRCTAG